MFRLAFCSFIASLAFGAVQPALAQQGDGLRVGAAVAVSPLYPGSGETHTRVLPTLQWQQGRWAIGPGAGGGLGVSYAFVANDGWRIGAAFDADLGRLREEADAPRLAGLGDVRGGRRLGAFAGYGGASYLLRGYIGHDVGDAELGTLAQLEAQWIFTPAPAWRLSLGPTLTWASRGYTQRLFGIDAEQSLHSGRPIYDADGGLHAAGVGAGLLWFVDRQWSAGLRLSARRLLGDAADSPITQDRWQRSALLFTGYAF